MSSRLITRAVAAAVSSALLFGNAGVATAGPEAPTGVPEDAARVLNLMSDAFANVSETVKPFVVSITTETDVERDISGFHNLPGLQEFFGDRFRNRSDEAYRQRGLGSGVIVSSDGFILTNNHVAGEADELKVRLSSGRVYEATLVGADAASDLAVIKIEPDEDLPSAIIGDSDRLRVGEWVIAVGSPFHLEHSVTAGIVSAKGRSTRVVTEYEDFIQTDCAINPGNSGGPLVNLDGEVVGINTAIATRSGGYQGIGFAIPANMARSIMNDLMSEGRVIRGWLGVMIQDLDQDMAESIGLDRPMGAIIREVSNDGAARAAGLTSGDVIVKFDGETIRDTNHLRNRVALTRPGTEVEVVVSRDGAERTFWVTLMERSELAQQDFPSTDRGAWSDPFGASVMELTDDVARELDTTLGDGGLVIESVERGSVAEDKQLQPGDIIRQMGREPISSASEYRERVDSLDSGDTVLLLVERDGRTRFVALKKP